MHEIIQPRLQGKVAASPSAVAAHAPRSVISPVTSRAGVTSNAGLPTGEPSGGTVPIAPLASPPDG